MKRFLALSLVLTVILMACTLTACSLFGGNDTASPCKNGHTWEDHEDLGEATCTMSGSVFKKCSVCGIKQEFTTPPIGHELKDKNVYVAPTCTEEGYKGTAICTRSGCDYVDNLEIIPTVDHKYGKWTSVGDGTHKKVCSYDSNHVLIEECSGGTATCSSQATCKICGGKYGELGTEHKFNKEIATEEYLNTEATCIELATYFYSCECGEIGDETFEYGDLADHDYVDGSCSVCGEADPTVSISLEGTYTATDDWNNSFAVVVTADTITFTPPMSNEVVVTYTYENGIVTLYADGSEITNPFAMSLTITDGALVGMMYNGNTYTITVGGAGEEPEDPEVLPGTFVVVDNMGGGALSGTYGYTIDEYNAVIVTKDDQYCSDFIFSIDMGGYWMVQIGSPSTNYLVNASYENVTVLAGELSVMTPGGAAYVFTFPASEGGEEEPEEGGDGTEANPYVVDDMPASITFVSDTINKVYYIFTASQTGAITFTWPNADSWYGITELDANGDNTANTTSGYETSSFSFNVTEGTKYRVELGTWAIAGEVTITVTYGEAGGEEEPTVLSAPVVIVDENGLASWEAVENASGYIYVINDGEEQTTTELSVQLEDGQSIKVKAVGDGTNYTDSDYSTVVTYTAPTEPEVITTIAGALAGSEGDSASLSGTVSEIYQAWNDYYGNMSFYLSDGTNRIIVFRAETQVGIGDEVTVEGTITIYQQTGVAQIAAGATVTITVPHVCSTFTEADCYNAAVCTVCGKENGSPLDHVDENSDGLCDNCGTDMESTASEITASKTIAELITSEGWTGSTTKQSFNLDDVVSVKVGGGSNSGKAYTDHIRIYATDTPAGSLTITVANGYELVSVKISAVTGTYAFLYLGDNTDDISNVSTVVSGSSVVLNAVKNGDDGKQVRVTAIEVVYKAVGGGEVVECEHTGGTATCTTKAVCTICGESYGDLDADNHEGTAEWTITETTHTQKYTCCEAVEVAEGNHEGGTATCIALAVCTVCEAEYGELAAHDTTFHEAVESTCVVYGNVEYWACSTCGKNFVSQEGGEEILNVKLDFDADNHGELVTVDAVAATCQSTGLTEGERCLDCGFYTIPQTVTDKLDCVDEDEDEVCDVCGSSLTCVHANFTYSVNTEDNTKHDKVCGLCNGVVETVAHVYVQTDYVAPDCDDAGTTEYTCSEYCGHVKYEDIEATGHSTTDLSYTYKDETTHNVICNVCNQEIEVADHAEFKYVVNAEDSTKHDKVCGLCNGVVATSEHNYVETGYTSPDCDDAGSIEYTCSDCDDKKSEEIPATGHSDTQFNYSVNTEDNTKHNVLCGICGEVVGTEDHNYEEESRIDATCVATGSVKHACTACGDSYTVELPVDETAHAWNEGEVTKEATCSAIGTKTYTCTHNAEHTKTEDIAIDENAHAWNEGEVTKEATCTQAGEMTFTCTYDSTHINTVSTEKADHKYDVDGTCTNCPAISKNNVVATFEFGANSDTATHKDGSSDKATYSETDGDYTLSITDGSKLYPNSYDAKGNSALKLGASSAGTFTFTVPNDGVTKVIIYVAGYKANTAKVQINGGDTITVSEQLSNNGEYQAIEVDVTSNKTVIFTTVSGGYRCMINSIEFVNKVECEHEGSTAGEVVAPTCTEKGYTLYTCTCGGYKWDFVDATGHDMQAVEAKEANCVDTGIMAHYVCNNCGIKSVDEQASETIESVEIPIDEDNHKSLEVLEAVEFTCTTDGKTEGEWCTACQEITTAQEIVYAHHVDNEPVDQKCDVCNATMCEHTETVWVSINDDQHVKKCTSCEEVVTTENHEYEVLKVNEPTCTEDGFTEYKCTVCEHEKDDDYVDATGHTIAYKNNDGSTHDTYCTVCTSDLETAVTHTDSGNGSCVCGKALAVEKTYSFAFTKAVFTANGTQELNGEAWTLAGDGGYWGNDSTKGQQFGSGNKPYKTLTLTSETSFSQVSKIIINTSGASSTNATLKVYVGDTPVDEITLTSTATSYEIDVSSLSGAVKFEYTQTSSKAIYIKSIDIKYMA